MAVARPQSRAPGLDLPARIRAVQGGIVALSDSGWELVLEACCFASMKHRDQRRNDAHASPFVNHAIEAVDLAARVGHVTDPHVLAAVALHDVLMSTSTTADDIECRFGPQVRRMVEEVTVGAGLPEEERQHRQLAWARTASPDARLIRLADKTSTLSALPSNWSAADRTRYLQWMSRLGAALGGTNAPLEALLAERLRQAWARPLGPARPARPAAADDCMAKLTKSADRLRRLLDKTEEAADSFSCELKSIGLPPVLTPHQPPPEPAPVRRSRRPRFADPIWKQLAEPGAESIRFTTRDRVTLVAINGAQPVELSPALALLLRILCSGSRDADGFPAFQSMEHIAAEMAKVTGHNSGVRGVVVAIGRLRGWLYDVKAPSPMLVETEPGPRARFRVRQAPLD